MLTSEQIAAYRDRAEKLADPIADFLLEDVARRVSEAGQLTSTAAYQAWQLQTLGVSQKELQKELKKRLKVSQKELDELLTQSAEAGYRFDLERLSASGAVSWEKNEALRQMAEETVEQTRKEVSAITQKLGLVDPYGKTLPLREAYRSCADFAFRQAVSGAADRDTAVRRAVKNLAERGVRVIDYESGRHASLEAAVRRSVMDNLGRMQERISLRNHDELGADGWEISAHANSAPDHEPFQGKQYSDEEYEALNDMLVRRIGTLNCGHAAFPIVMGVSEPRYTEEELEQFRADNERGVTVDGRHYTGCEAVQERQRLERAVRTQKRRVLVDKAAGDEEKLLTDQIRLKRYEQEHSRFSKAAGLRTENERAQVAGAEIEKISENFPKGLAKYSNSVKTEFGKFNTTDDPMREVTGCGLDSNPKEIQAILDDLRASGVEIRYVGNNMAYAPGILPGTAGQFIIDRQASYSAWAHEYKHFCDDRADGFQGLRIFMDTEKCIQREVDAYNVEIELAKKADRPDIIKRLEELKEQEVRRFDADANAD